MVPPAPPGAGGFIDIKKNLPLDHAFALEFNGNRYDSGAFAEFDPFLAVFTACLTRGVFCLAVSRSFFWESYMYFGVKWIIDEDLQTQYNSSGGHVTFVK